MKAIILAAGRGTRLKPITDTTPKPLIKIRGKSILEYFLEQVYSHVNEIILIVNYKSEMFQETFGDSYCGIPITYHIQGEKKGTGGALIGLQSMEDICVFYADTIFESHDVETLLTYDGYGCLVQEVEHPEKYGIFSQDEHKNAIEVVEKPQEYIGNLANLGFYKFGGEILELVQQLTPSPRGEYELTDAINKYCKNQSFKLFPITGRFLDISYPDDIHQTEIYFQNIAQSLLKDTPRFGESVFLCNIKDLQLFYGISINNIGELINYSQDENDRAIQKNTGDKKRFSKIEKIQSWYETPGRHIFSLIDHNNTLAGIWWGRPCQAPELENIENQEAHQILQDHRNNLHTNAIRIYPDFRGKKIATTFVNTCMMYYRDIFPDGVMCIDTDTENIPLQKSYEKSGYQKIGIGIGEKSVESTKERLIYIQKSK